MMKIWREFLKEMEIRGWSEEKILATGIVPPISGGMPEPERGTGGYTSADALRSSEREIVLLLSPAAATASAAVEQTFTVPGLAASDRVQSFQPTTGLYSGTSLIGVSFRTSAISVIAIAFVNAGTSAGQPTTSARYAISYKSWRQTS